MGCDTWGAALYTLDDVPWIIDLKAGRKDDLIPTVFALQKLPRLLPVVSLKHSDVAHFILSELPCPIALRLSRLWLCHHDVSIGQTIHPNAKCVSSTVAMRVS